MVEPIWKKRKILILICVLATIGIVVLIDDWFLQLPRDVRFLIMLLCACAATILEPIISEYEQRQREKKETGKIK